MYKQKLPFLEYLMKIVNNQLKPNFYRDKTHILSDTSIGMVYLSFCSKGTNNLIGKDH